MGRYLIANGTVIDWLSGPRPDTAVRVGVMKEGEGQARRGKLLPLGPAGESV